MENIMENWLPLPVMMSDNEGSLFINKMETTISIICCEKVIFKSYLTN